MSRLENWNLAYAKTKAQISCAVTAQLISTLVFATRIVQVSLCQTWSQTLRQVFSRRGSYDPDSLDH